VEKVYIEFLLSRRSIRKFKDKEVSKDILLKILDIARYAPSARNAQPWEYIVITDKSIIRELSKTRGLASKPLENAAAAIAVVTDPSISPNTHMIDGACTTMYILLAAHALGLGAVWINALDHPVMKKILRIPESKFLLCIIALGYPDEKPKAKPRKPLNELVHYETYKSIGESKDI